MSRPATEEVKRKRAVQGALSITGATLGLAALGTKGGAVALRRYPKALKSVTINPKRLDSASLGLMTTGAGTGGLSGYHYAALQRAENKSQRKMERDNKMLEHSAFGVVTKAMWDDKSKEKKPDTGLRATQYGGYGAAAAGLGGALAAKDISGPYVKYRLKKVKRTEKATVKARDKTAAARTKYSENVEAEKPNTGKTVRGAKANWEATQKLGRLADKKINIRTTGTPKVRAAALGLGAAGLVASEAARQRRKVKKNDEWWSDSN